VATRFQPGPMIIRDEYFVTNYIAHPESRGHPREADLGPPPGSDAERAGRAPRPRPDAAASRCKRFHESVTLGAGMHGVPLKNRRRGEDG
jgi:hypothetical protein